MNSLFKLKGGRTLAVGLLLLLAGYYLTTENSYSIGSGDQANLGPIGLGYPFVLVGTYRNGGGGGIERYGNLYSFTYVGIETRDKLLYDNGYASWLTDVFLPLATETSTAKFYYIKTTVEFKGKTFTYYAPLERILDGHNKYQSTLHRPPFTSDMPIFDEVDVIRQFYNTNTVIKVTSELVHSSTDVGHTQLIDYMSYKPSLFSMFRGHTLQQRLEHDAPPEEIMHEAANPQTNSQAAVPPPQEPSAQEVSA